MTSTVNIATIGKSSAEQIRVTLENFRGRDRLDIRTYASFTPANVPMATKRGISVPVECIAELRRALEEAEAKAAELGLLVGAKA